MTIETLIQESADGLDLTSSEDLLRAKAAAEAVEGLGLDVESLALLELELVERGDVPLVVHLAVKLARSRALVRKLVNPLHLSVVFAVYKEHNRIKHPAEHPHGEDFLRRKVAQLEWLCEESPGLTWDMTVVDDGCPEESGARAAEIVEAEGLSGRVRVLWLQEALEQRLPVSAPMESTSASQKGGSIEYGMWAASRKPREGQIILFTDADLSTHLGQAGLLVEEIVHGGADAAIGSRREPSSVVIKKGTRNTRGKLFIYLWKRLIPELNHVIDTQCGFKAFRAETVRVIIEQTIEKGFAFDIELLLKTEMARAHSIAKVPIAWIDSEAASTTTDLEPYLPMLRSICAISRHYLPRRVDAEPFARLIESLDDSGWQCLVQSIPEDIAEGDPATFGDWSGVHAEDLAARCKPDVE